MEEKLILVGRFGAPHGVSGEVRLTSYTGDPKAIASYKPLLDGSGSRELSILRLRPLKGNMFVAKVVGVDDRASARSLTNAGLYVPREALPNAAEEEFYLADLIGLAAVTETGEEFGRIVDILNFGGGDILEISPKGGGATLLLPFNREVVPHVDLAGGRLIVVPPGEVEAPASCAER
jgi:16S rRNA processing protein RimM